MKPNLKVGDVVRLKSGGPKIKVKEIFVSAYGFTIVKCHYRHTITSRQDYMIEDVRKVK